MDKQQGMSMTKKDPIMAWLADWGFADNPFGIWEASHESLLQKYFVKHPFYEQLRDDHASTLVFASRGHGKTALRLMLQSECRPQQPHSPVFAVSFTEFSSLVAKVEQNQECTVADYLRPFFSAATGLLLEAISDLVIAGATFSPADWGELHYYSNC